MERYNITVKDNPFDGCPYADMVVSDDGAYVRYDDAQRALDAERERLKVQIDYSIQLQRLIESLMYDDTPSPDLYPHTIIVDFKRQLATLQAQLRRVEGELAAMKGATNASS